MRRVTPPLALAALTTLVLASVLGSAQYQPLEQPNPSAYMERTDLAEAGTLPDAQRVTRFIHVSDAHIIDDDAPYPMRQEILDLFGAPFESAQRPQEEYTDEILNRIIAAINDIHAADPLDFVINTGDNIDNELENELMRFLDNWEGTVTTVGPISGRTCVPDGQSESVDDDANDVTNQCTSLPVELAQNNTPLAGNLPWYSAFGNHDGLIQGNVPIEPSFNELASQFGRQFLRQTEYVAMHFQGAQSCPGGNTPAGSAVDDWGHGYGYATDRLCDSDPDNDGYYAFEQGGIRFLVLDTVNDDFVTANENLQGLFNPEDQIGYDLIGGYAQGSLDPAQFDWMIQQITDNPDQLIVLMSHHTVNSFISSQMEGNCSGGYCLDDLMTEAGYKTAPDVIEALNDHTNVIAWIGGHTHQHRIQPKSIAGAPSPGFWNIETSSLIDLPQEARVVEVWVTDNGTRGFLRLDRFTHDHGLGRTLAETDPQHDVAHASGEDKDRDVLLWFDIPEGVVLTPQPILERLLDIEIASPVPDVNGTHGEKDHEVHLAFHITDNMTGAGVDGLNATVTTGYADGTGLELFNIVLAEGTPLTGQGNGTYDIHFTPPAPGTYFTTIHVEDASGLYLERSAIFTLVIGGEAEPTDGGAKKESPAVSPALLVAGLALVALAGRKLRPRA